MAFSSEILFGLLSPVLFLKIWINCLCPGFIWDRVNFHRRLGGDRLGRADPNRPGGILNTRWPNAQQIAGGAGWRRGCAAWEQAGHQAVRKLQCVSLTLYVLLVVLSLLFSSFFAVLLNCLYPNLRVLPLSSSSPPIPLGWGGSERAAAWFFIAGWAKLRPYSTDSVY